MSDGPGGPHSDRKSFDERLGKARQRAGLKEDKGASQQHETSALGLAMRLGTETVAALGVAVAIGYGLDRLFHSAPWFMIGFVPIGAAAGVLNLIRAMDTSANKH